MSAIRIPATGRWRVPVHALSASKARPGGGPLVDSRYGSAIVEVDEREQKSGGLDVCCDRGCPGLRVLRSTGISVSVCVG